MEIGDKVLIKKRPSYWSSIGGGKDMRDQKYPVIVEVVGILKNDLTIDFLDNKGAGWCKAYDYHDCFEVLPKEEKNMIIYKTKEILNRTVTVCVKVASNMVVTAGYSVTHPDDDFDKEIAKKISLGRASKDKTNVLEPMFLGEGMEKKYILFAIADAVFRDIENKKITIKGIRV